MSNDAKNTTERRVGLYNAKIEKLGLSHSDIATMIRTNTGRYVERSTISRILSGNDPYQNTEIEADIASVLGIGLSQWERLLNWYLLGKKMTARDFVIKIGPTQIHARHIEIGKYAGYIIQEEGDLPILGDRVIMSRWMGGGNGRYKEYWIPKTQQEELL